MPGRRLRPWHILIATIVAITWLSIPYAARHAMMRSKVIHHENPAIVAADPDPTAIFQWYQVAVSQFTSWRFREGRRLIGQLRQANLPPEIGSMVVDLNDLLTEEGSILETADGLFRNASALIAAGKVETAKQLLAQLRGHIRNGTLLLDDAVQSFEALARRVNVEALPPDAPQRQAYIELRRIAVRIKALLLTSEVIAKNPQTTVTFAKLLPYQTKLDLSVPPIAYPGRAFTVSGTVTEQAPTLSIGRVLVLGFDDQVLAELPLGRFHQDVILPQGTLPALHRITATVPAQGRYLGASVQKDIRVSQAVPVLWVRWPKFAVAPGRIALRGTAYSAFGPLRRAVIQAEVERTVRETQLSETEDFQLTLDLPATLNLVGPKTVSVRLLPSEPWHASVELQANLLIINLINAGLVALLLPAAGLLYAGTRRRTSADRPWITPAEEPISVPAIQKPLSQYIVTTYREQLLVVYRDALQSVQAAAAVRMYPSSTLREFAGQVQPKLRSNTFTQMTGLAEVTLYSSHEITHPLVEQMQHLWTQLQTELASALT